MENVIGHEKAKHTLRVAIDSGHISHAYIFEGAAGIGRMTLAKAFAEELVACPKGFNADSHPDIIVVENELYGTSRKTGSLSVEAVRAMRADAYIKPYMSDRKVYIIPNADSMLPVAQNSLLKVFEEPPEYCTIILLACNTNGLLPTILSRASIIRMHPLPTESVYKYLAERSGIESSAAKAIAAMSGGSIGRALLLSESDEAILLRQNVIGHLMNIAGSGFRQLYDFIKFLKQNRQSIRLILDIMAGWSCDVLHIKFNAGDGYEILNSDKAEELKRFCSAVTRRSALHFEEIIAKYSLAISRNANYSIAVQCMATEYWEEIHGKNYRSAL